MILTLVRRVNVGYCDVTTINRHDQIVPIRFNFNVFKLEGKECRRRLYLMILRVQYTYDEEKDVN